MATDRRRAVATATTGAGLTAAGGVLRHQGLQAANRGKIPAWEWRHPGATHPTRALLRTGARGRRRYLLGATLGLVGAPALAVGVHDTFSRRETAAKRDSRKNSFVHEGLKGTQDALEQRAESIKEVPPQHKIGPLAVSAGAGFTGSLAAHRSLDRLKSFQGGRRHAARAGITALAGTTVAGASYPLARHTVRSSEYEVTPTGVRRRKRPVVRPSSKATRQPVRQRSLREDLAKVHNPHSLTPLTSRGTPRKVHWPHRSGNRAICGLDGAFGRGTGPFAEHYGEVTCIGCQRMMRIRKALTPKVQARAEGLLHRLDERMEMRTLGDMQRRGRMGAKDDEFYRHKLRAHAEDQGKKNSLGDLFWRAARVAGTRPLNDLDRHDARRAELRVLRGRQSNRWMEARRRASMGQPVSMPRDRRIGKADYSGRRTSTHAQRAAILAAGATPVIGGIAGARTAGHFAPPKQRMHTETRQYGLTAAGSIGGGLAGAYGTAALAQRHAGVARASEKVADAHNRVGAKVRNLKPVNAAMSRMPKGGRVSQAVARGKTIARESKVAGPLRAAPAAALAGYVAGKTVGGVAGSGLAMRRNQADQREYNLKHPVVKYVENMTVAERRKLSRKKRYAAASSTTTGVLGLGALAARAKGKPDLALNMLTGSAAVGGVNNLNFAGVLRREAKAADPRKNVGKGLLVAKADRREPLTRMRADTAAEIVRRHGDAGPLPSNLSRPERMQAYEARYVHAGGHKAEHWQRRADRADKVKVAGLAGATAGGAGIMALRHPRVVRALGRRAEHARHAVDTATIGAATVSGAGELYAGHARRKRSSYSNSKAGVAASALRRMRDYAA